MQTFLWSPAPGASLAVKPTMETAKYGDGYEQRVGTGINSQMDKWSLTFMQNVADILAFLKARNGADSFAWTDPLGAGGVYVCREWKVSHVGGAVFSLSCDFEQVPA